MADVPRRPMTVGGGPIGEGPLGYHWYGTRLPRGTISVKSTDMGKNEAVREWLSVGRGGGGMPGPNAREFLRAYDPRYDHLQNREEPAMDEFDADALMGAMRDRMMRGQ